MNRAIIVGNLTKDPELKTTSQGVACAKFTVAVQRKYRDSQGQYGTDFINCVAWRGTAEFICKHFIKGNRIGVEGSIQTRNYEAQDGSKRTAVELAVDNAEFVTPKQGNMEQPQTNVAQGDGYTEVPEDELPF